MLSRRQLLKAGGALAGVSASALLLDSGRSAVAGGAGVSQRIALFNLHTAEHLDVEYLRDGVYRSEALAAVETLLRDFRTGERHPIDPHLLDYLTAVARTLNAEPSFEVISGYRSPHTNAALRSLGRGVAERSLHMEGRAVDVRMAHIECAQLAAHAQDLQRGGVGYYRESNFVHLDTGSFRTWNG